MINRSLFIFLFFSIATHAAVVGLWPDTEQAPVDNKECSIEIGMVTLPRIDLDFTRDLSRLQHLTQMVQRQKSTQKPTIPAMKLTPSKTGQQINKEALKAISNQIMTEAITKSIDASAALTSVAISSPIQNNQPVTAAKAAPIYAINPAPAYPANALRSGWEGEVWLKVIVDRTGSVGKIVIERSSNYQILDQAAINTVRNWHFEPARVGKEATEGAVSIPIRFQIKRS